MLELFGSLFTSIVSGGLTGIAGVVVQRYADYKNKQLDIEMNKVKFQNDIDLKQIDLEIIQEESNARVKVAEIETEGRSDVADSNAFSQSFYTEPQRYSEKVKTTQGQAWLFVVLDFIRGLIRPTLTVYLCVLSTLVYTQARTLIEQGLSPTESLDLVKQVVGTILYLTTTCVLWWFGTRNKGPQPKIKS